jgi:allantoicase/malate synthase
MTRNDGTAEFFEIPEYHRYLSPRFARGLLADSQEVPGIAGLRQVGRGPVLENPEALRFLVDLYRELKPRLAAVLRQRVADRAFIDERTRACFELNRRLGLKISDPEYHTVLGLQDSEGRIVIGPQGEHYYRPGGEPVAPIPAHLQGSHVTLFGPPDNAKLAVNAMNAYHRKLPGEPAIVGELLAQLKPESASPKWGADDEDSKTPMHASLVDAAKNLKGCFDHTLVVEEPGAKKKYELAGDHLALPIKRFPGLALPCAFLFVDESPVPLHLYDFALHLFEHRARPDALVFYVPKLENEEEAAYIHAMISAAEQRIRRDFEPSYQLGTVRLMIVLENPRAILRTHEIMDALHPYFAGASLGWHDYLGSTARLFKEDGNYRIPVKADPDIVIKYIQASHRIVTDVVGSRGGIKVGGMYGILPVTTDLRSPSFQVTLLGYFKDVITQMKRGLTGFWVAHPDFIRLGLALVQAWKLREAGEPAPLGQLCREILDEPHAREIEAFIERADIVGLTPGQPGYVRKLLVADLEQSDTIANHDPEEIRYNVFQSLQYLVDWLSGNGCVALPAIVKGTPVRVMDDLATAERSRWEVWHEIRHGRVAREEFLKIAFEELQFIRKDLSNDQKIVQVKWDERTAKWYPVAFHLMVQLMTAADPVEFATELLLPFTLDAVRQAPDPLDAIRELDARKYSLEPWVERFCRYFEVCGSVRFARTMADLPLFDLSRARALVECFALEDILEAASFHGTIGEPKRGLDALAAAEQAGVSEAEQENLRQLRELGARYLERFGFKFLISARGRSGAEMLEALKHRLARPRDEELAAAREALWTITETRLKLSPPDQVLASLEQVRARHRVRASGIALLTPEGIQSLGLGCSSDTAFEIASLSKTIASAYSMELFRERGIDLHASTSAVLKKLCSPIRLMADSPGMDPDQVTLAHLMSHQALGQHYVKGFDRGVVMPPIEDLIQGTPAAMAAGYPGVQVVNVSGTRFQYSGGGFLVLEHLVELLTRKPAPEATRDFLEQLGLKAMTFSHQEPHGMRVAEGYFDSGERVAGGRLNFPGFAAGAIGSAGDMARVLRHLERAYQDLEGSCGISHDTAVRMLHGKDLGCRAFMGCEIGLGVFVIEAGENRLMLHQGSNEGFRALFLHCFSGPDTGKGFVIFCNADNSGVAFVAEIAQQLLRHLEFSGVDFDRFISRFDDSSIPQEQRVNLGYRERIFRAFQPQLPDPIREPGAPDPLAEWNLASRAKVGEVSNQRFARAENLISRRLPTFDPKLYCRQGKVMDSWESARHNPAGVDFVELELEKPSSIRFVSFSTQYHDGNHPEAVRVLGRTFESSEWHVVVDGLPLQGHSLMKFALEAPTPKFDQIRVEMYPDGGLSRLGLYADLPESVAREFGRLADARPTRFAPEIPKPSKPLTIGFEAPASRRPATTGRVDWASLAQGGRVAGVTNEHYGPASQVISPYPPLHMFDGFESARSRKPGHFETLELQFATTIFVDRIVLDFEYFVNNNPRAVRILRPEVAGWSELVPLTDVKAFAANRKAFELPAGPKLDRLKFEIHPDGGINRVSVYGVRA